MHYGLGIDAGGTYTDAVILRGSDGKIVDSTNHSQHILNWNMESKMYLTILTLNISNR